MSSAHGIFAVSTPFKRWWICERGPLPLVVIFEVWGRGYFPRYSELPSRIECRFLFFAFRAFTTCCGWKRCDAFERHVFCLSSLFSSLPALSLGLGKDAPLLFAGRVFRAVGQIVVKNKIRTFHPGVKPCAASPAR
jgi:hypothetical protein